MFRTEHAPSGTDPLAPTVAPQVRRARERIDAGYSPVSEFLYPSAPVVSSNSESTLMRAGMIFCS